MLNRRTFNLLPLLGALPAGRVLADDFPSRSIRLVAAFSPGSATDTLGRFIANHMAQSLNTQVIVENKVGAGGLLAAEFIAKSAPDGYNLLFTTASHYALPVLTEKMPYDTYKDFAAVGGVAQAALIWTVASDSPYRTLQDIIRAAKADSSSVTYSTSGPGTSVHMAGALLNSMAGIHMRHVPYKVASQAIMDASTGQVTTSISGVSGAMPLIKAGKLRALAITSATRSSLLPDVPTVAESGLAGYQVVTPIFALARAGTPHDVLAVLSKAMEAGARSPEFAALCTNQSLDVAVQDEATLAAAMPEEYARWKVLAELAAKQG